MITVEELKENGFESPDWLSGYWYHPKFKVDNYHEYNFPLNENGEVTFIRESDNYHGLTVEIKTIEKLLKFFEFLEKVKED